MPLWLEAGKFSLYLALPIGLAYFMSFPENVNRVVNQFKFVVNPPQEDEHTLGTTTVHELIQKKSGTFTKK